MKNITITILLFISSLSFAQNNEKAKSNTSSSYTENSKISVIYNENSDKVHTKTKPTGIFVNKTFIGDQIALTVINSAKIESLNMEKKGFQKNGKEYSGKIIVKMKPEYTPKFISLKTLIKKYLEINNNPIVIQINENVIEQDYSELLVDENFILKIILKKIKTSGKKTEINLIKVVTKTKENIRKANKILLKGRKIRTIE